MNIVNPIALSANLGAVHALAERMTDEVPKVKSPYNLVVFITWDTHQLSLHVQTQIASAPPGVQNPGLPTDKFLKGLF